MLIWKVAKKTLLAKITILIEGFTNGNEAL